MIPLRPLMKMLSALPHMGLMKHLPSEHLLENVKRVELIMVKVMVMMTSVESLSLPVNAI
jgi:hypothetical protein